MLLWASEFVTAKIVCSFEMGKQIPLEVPFILLLMEPFFSHLFYDRIKQIIAIK